MRAPGIRCGSVRDSAQTTCDKSAEPPQRGLRECASAVRSGSADRSRPRSGRSHVFRSRTTRCGRAYSPAPPDATAAARLRLGPIRTGAAAGLWPLPRPAASANETSDSGTSGSPRSTRARYSPVAEPSVAATFSGVPSATISAAPGAALGPEVDDPVGGLDDVEVVLDDDDRVAGVDEPVEHLEELLDVGEVEAGRRLVEEVERLARRAPRQLGRQLDALRLAARQRRRRLAEVDVAEADVEQRLELACDVRDRPRRTRAPPRSVISRTSAIERPL